VAKVVTRDIICVECPDIYSEREIIAHKGDETKPLVEVLGATKSSGTNASASPKSRGFRRLLSKERVDDNVKASPLVTTNVQRDVLKNINRLKDWTFTCPKGHTVDGNRGFQIPLAVVGSSGSSKSHILPGMIWETSLLRALSRLGITLRQGPFTSSQLSYSSRQLYNEQRILPPTPPDAVSGPFGYRLSIREGSDESRYSLLLFDVGGEALSSITKISEQAAFVLLAQGLIILIDPQHVVSTQFDAVDAGINERERVIAAADVRDSITLIADALEELWEGSMKQIPIPACFVIAKADSLSWNYDWAVETSQVIEETLASGSMHAALVGSSDRVKSEFAEFGGGLIIDEIEERFDSSRVRFVAASATSEMPGTDGWENPTPAGISLALLHILEMLGRTRSDRDSNGGGATPSPSAPVPGHDDESNGTW
jgi:double-GTPase-like protein